MQKKKSIQVMFGASGIVMELHCCITVICKDPMSSLLFSVLFSVFQIISGVTTGGGTPNRIAKKKEKNEGATLI